MTIVDVQEIHKIIEKADKFEKYLISAVVGDMSLPEYVELRSFCLNKAMSNLTMISRDYEIDEIIKAADIVENYLLHGKQS